MAIDLAVLTTTVVSSFLLPYVQIGAQKLVEGMAGQVGKGAAEHASGVAKQAWERIKGVFTSDDEKAVVAQFEKRPEAAKPLLEAMLQEKLAENPQLAQELDSLLNAPGPDGTTTGAQIMHAGVAGIVDARAANFSNAQGVTITGVNVSHHPQDDQPK